VRSDRKKKISLKISNSNSSSAIKNGGIPDFDQRSDMSMEDCTKVMDSCLESPTKSKLSENVDMRDEQSYLSSADEDCYISKTRY